MARGAGRKLALSRAAWVAAACAGNLLFASQTEAAKNATPAMAMASASRSADPGACQAPQPVQHTLQAGLHVLVCSPLTFTEYPPTSGKHYPVWADYKTYASVLEPGFYVHDMEHGAVVFLINCNTAGDCRGDIARLQGVADAYPQDPLCDAKTRHRIVIAEDTSMAMRFAALSWGWSLQSECLDTLAFKNFLAAHYGQGTEDFCDPSPDFVNHVSCPAGIVPPMPENQSLRTERKRAPILLWQGSLAETVSLWLDVVSVNGSLLAHYDLGRTGPGPARAAFDSEAFHRGHPAAGPVVCRVLMRGVYGQGLQAETLIFP